MNYLTKPVEILDITARGRKPCCEGMNTPSVLMSRSPLEKTCDGYRERVDLVFADAIPRSLLLLTV